MNLHFTALLTLSWRNLWRNKRRTTIMLGAITVGVWAMIFMTALMRGMVDDMLNQGIRNLPGHIQVQHASFLDDPSVVNSIVEPDASMRKTLDELPGVNWATRIRVPAVIASERETRGINLIGIEVDAEAGLSGLPGLISAGRFLESDADEGIIVGARLLERLETGLGKRVVVTSQDPANNIRERGFRIVGIYRAKLPGLEEFNVYAARDTLQQLLRIDGRVSQLVFMGEDFRQVDPLRQRLRKLLPADLQIRTWYEIDSYLAPMYNMMDGFVLVWIIIIFLALSFGLVNTLVMAIFERVREIGLIQALGMRPALIVYQILLESLLLLLIGLGLGNLLALATIIPIQDGVDVSVVAEGMAMMGAGSILYPSLYLSDMLLANCVVILLGILTSTLPAWRAAKLDPVRALNSN